MKKEKIERISRVKIIGTLGPASNDYTVIRKLIRSGLDVARLNFSHGSHKEHLRRIMTVREVNKKYRRRVRILQDLEGFRIRVGRFKGAKNKFLENRSTVWFTREPDNGDPRIIPFDYEGDPRKIRPGKIIFIDDGNMIFEARSATKKAIKAKVIEGGLLKERKGINIPDVRIPFAGVTEKDKKDMEFGIRHKVDFLAQSFVRSARDMETVKSIVKPRLPGCGVIAKVESKEAIRNIDSIIDASDGIMVARGDMGTAVPIHQIGLIQKMIIKKCNRRKKFVITATQMLEHMTEHSRPSRAEVTDVTNAILDGTDYVMLSAESASGKYPVEAVKMMDLIIKFTETYVKQRKAGILKEAG